MRKTRNAIAKVVLAALILMGFAAQGQAEYYENKRVTVLVNYGAGGTTDIIARVIAKHLGRFIPGNPELIVKNMPGAGGITATNHMGEVVDTDGLTIAVFSPPIVQQLMSDPALSVDLSSFVWLGGIGQSTACLIRKDAGNGVSNVDDLLTLDGFKVAGYRATTSTDIRMRLALDLFGMEYVYIPGYRSVAKVGAALLQNEAQFTCVSNTGLRNNFGPSLIDTGQAIPLWYFSVVDAQGNQVRDARFEDLPTFIDVFERLKGERPSGMLFDSLTLINNLVVSMLRGVFVPGGTPDEAVAALRTAWDALAKDREFMKEYRAVTSEPPVFLDNTGAEEQLKKLADLDPGMINFLQEFVEQN